MEWYYVRDSQQDGPHTDEGLKELVRAGVINAETLIWREGMPEWKPLRQAAPHVASTAGNQVACTECGGVFVESETVPIRDATLCAKCKPLYLQKLQEGVAGHRSVELERLLKIAKAQRGVNITILSMLALYAMIFVSAGMGKTSPQIAGWLMMAAGVGVIAMVVLQVLYVYRLASSLGSLAILWVLGVLFLGCIGLLLLLYLSSKATRELRAAGFKVGLLGGNPADVEAAMAR